MLDKGMGDYSVVVDGERFTVLIEQECDGESILSFWGSFGRVGFIKFVVTDAEEFAYLVPPLHALEAVEEAEGVAMISLLQVEPKYRNRGIGSSLIIEAFKSIMQEDYEIPVALYASSLDTSAYTLDGLIAFYERFGFRLIEGISPKSVMMFIDCIGDLDIESLSFYEREAVCA